MDREPGRSREADGEGGCERPPPVVVDEPVRHPRDEYGVRREPAGDVGGRRRDGSEEVEPHSDGSPPATPAAEGQDDVRSAREDHQHDREVDDHRVQVRRPGGNQLGRHGAGEWRVREPEPRLLTGRAARGERRIRTRATTDSRRPGTVRRRPHRPPSGPRSPGSRRRPPARSSGASGPREAG